MEDKIHQIIQNQYKDISLYPLSLPFNGHQYVIGITIFNLTKGSQYVDWIRENSLKQLIIENNLQTMYPSFELVFIDRKGSYTNVMHHLGQYVRICVKQADSTQTDEEQNLVLNGIFSVQSHKIIGVEDAAILYKLSGILWTAKNLSMHLNYATQINKQQNNKKSPYKIISDILTKINYPIKTEFIPETKNKIYFISDQNKTAKNMIKYCLQMACGPQDPPTYLYHDILSDQPILMNNNWQKLNRIYDVNVDLQLVSQRGVMANNKELIVLNPRISPQNTTTYYYQDQSLDIQWQYDHLKRTWKQNICTPNNICEILKDKENSKENTKIQSLLIKQDYKNGLLRRYRTNHEHNIYDKLKNIDLCTNNLTFSIQGSILHQVGQMININSKNQNYLNTLGGIWVVSNIKHIFKGESYMNNISGYKKSKIKIIQDDENAN